MSTDLLNSLGEIHRAKQMLSIAERNSKKVKAAMVAHPKPPQAKTQEVSYTQQAPQPPLKEFDFANTKNLKPQGTPLNFPSPLYLLRAIAPEMMPHLWQVEELQRLGGYLDPTSDERIIPDEENRLLYGLPAANGSGKDQFIFAAFAVWFVVVGCKNRLIGTSFDSKQIKDQSEPSIKYLIDRFCEKFGKHWFRSVQGHHVCVETGSEIVLFATDDPGRAEGYHPWPGGKMALVVNEAKNVPEAIFDAIRRCTGYSYFILISSPAGKSGTFYNNSLRGVRYPAPCKLNQWFYRHVSAHDCPHIPRSHIEEQTSTMPAWWVNSSINAEFSDADDSVIIPDYHLLSLAQNLPPTTGEDIGIGLDTAGGVDENSCWVRRGNEIIYEFHFRQRDTTETAAHIDAQLAPWKHLNYIFNADDGGISQAITDNIVKLGWRVSRRRNQSPANNKSKFLNLGAESWWNLRMLIIRKEIRLNLYNKDKTINSKYAKLLSQLTSRRLDGKESSQGKLKLEPKPEHKQRMRESPDRADALVLCFYGYKSRFFEQPKAAPQRPVIASMQEFAAKYGWEEIPGVTTRPKTNATYRFTFQSRAI